MVGAAVAGVTIGTFGGLFMQVGRLVSHGSGETVVARIQTDSGQLTRVRGRHLAESVLSRGDDGSLALDLRFVHGKVRFEGNAARRIAAIVVPKVNRFGGARKAVADAAASLGRPASMP